MFDFLLWGELNLFAVHGKEMKRVDMLLDENVLTGMPTLIELKSIEENIELCKRFGLSLIELNMNLPYLQLKNLKNINKEDEIQFSIHL